jgi:hypothetical protein
MSTRSGDTCWAGCAVVFSALRPIWWARLGGAAMAVALVIAALWFVGERGPCGAAVILVALISLDPPIGVDEGVPVGAVGAGSAVCGGRVALKQVSCWPVCQRVGGLRPRRPAVSGSGDQGQDADLAEGAVK